MTERPATPTRPKVAAEPPADGHFPAAAAARGAAVVSGVLATGVALAVTEVASGALDGVDSLVLAVGTAVIDSVPGWLERAAIETLGSADKPVLVGSILLVCAALGGAIGMIARRHPVVAGAGIAAVAGMGALASLQDQRTVPAAAAVVAAVGAAAGIATLIVLLRAATVASGRPSVNAVDAPSPEGVDRRPFLRLALVAAAVAASGVAVGQWLTSPRRLEEIRAALRLPAPARPAPAVPAGADLGVAGLTPLFVPNDNFYRIDTALTVPRIDPAGWTLDVRGMVDRPFRVTYAELLDMPHLEADITLACVSNAVGGDLVGNARWQGVPLRALLNRAGVRPEATQLLSRSVDGFSAGFPTGVALSEPRAMVAVAMNGAPLPAEHGFPARIVVPGLYGYVSATKWLSSIELTTFDDATGYWIPRGWAQQGPVKTQSRIDVPAATAPLTPGPQAIAGVAWAPTRGVERVEVRIDDGPWQEARLAAALNVDTWRQWVLDWEATPGRHTLAVRATDGTGDLQTDQRTPIAPDGASGWHNIQVVVQEP